MQQTPSVYRRVLAVLCGGFLGTLARYFLSLAVQGWLGKGWPYDILLINLTGALLLAFVSTLADATLLVGPTRRLLINTGFMGAYTTFSSLALGDILLLNKGELVPALLYLVISLLGGLCMVLLGTRLAQPLIVSLRRPAPIPEAILEPEQAAGQVEDDILLQIDSDEAPKMH